MKEPLREMGEVKIFSWNVNGIRARLKDDLLANFIAKEKPDILCLNETKICVSKLMSEKIRQKFAGEFGFPLQNQFWNHAKKAGYSGTSIMVSKRFVEQNGAPIKVDNDFGPYGKHDQEGRAITCHFREFILVNVYVPNSGFKGLERLKYRIEDWDTDLHNYLKDLEETRGKPVILCGDLNVAHTAIDIFNPSQAEGTAGFTKEERDSLSKFLEQKQFVDTYRHFNPSKKQFTAWLPFGNGR